MTKESKLGIGAAGVVIGGILVYFIANTISDQRATQQQLDEMKKQMAAASQPQPSPVTSQPGTPAQAVSTPPTTLDGSAMAKEKATQEYLAQGFALLNKRDPKSAAQAATLFREAIDKVDNTNPFFYNGLGRSLIIAGKYPDAVQAFVDGLKVDPKRAELSSGLGWALWNLKQYYLAKQAWEEAVKLDPKSEDALMALSWIYLAMGEDDKSRLGFVILVALDPNRPEWNTGLAMARAPNHNLDQIRAHFDGMPDPTAFNPPPTSRP